LLERQILTKGEKHMSKKSIFIVLGTVLAVIIASVVLVFTIGTKTSADSQSDEVVVVPTEYLYIYNGSLNGITYDGVQWIAGREFRVEIPDSVTKISGYAFSGRTGLKSITIPDSVTSIDMGAFKGTGLTSVMIPDSVTSIGDYAFADCTGLTSIMISDSVTSIGDEVFRSCTNLTSVTFGENPQLNSIGKSAFYCTGLTSITIPNAVTSIKNQTFYGCTGLTTITIPNSVTSIGDYAFYDCTGLISVTFGDDSQLTSIGSNAFCNCKSLTSITIPNGVTSFGDSAFSSCTSLAAIIISDSVTSVGHAAFYNWTSAQIIACEADTQPDGWSSTWNLGCNAQIAWGNARLVMFNTNGGSAVDAQIVDVGEQASEPTDPVRTYYTFVGWYTDAELQNEYDFSSAVTENVRLYAKWEGDIYAVTFNSNNGSAVNAQDVEYPNCATKPTDPTRENYVFMGWYLNGSLYDFSAIVTDDITLQAQWGHTVSFDTDGGSVIEAQNVIDGETAYSRWPYKQYYNFDGWYLNDMLYNFDTPVTQDITLTAHWSIVHYTVSFDANGADMVPEQDVARNSTVTEPTEPTRDGYFFCGWYQISDSGLGYAVDEYDFSTPVTEDMTLTAVWKKIYKVTYSNVTGDVFTASEVTEGDLAVTPNVSLTGYTLQGWYVDPTCTSTYDFNEPVMSDLTLYATMEINTYTVTFNTNCDATIAARTVEYGETVSEPVIVRDGYTFAGWYTDAALTSEYDFATAVTEDLTLYAKWEADTAEESETPIDDTDSTVNEETSAVVNADKNNMVAVIAGTSVGTLVLIVIGITVGVVLTKKRRQ